MAQVTSGTVARGVVSGLLAFLGVLCLIYAAAMFLWVAPLAARAPADKLRIDVEEKRTAGVAVDELVLGHEEQIARVEGAAGCDTAQRLASVALIAGSLCFIPFALAIRRR